MKKFFTFILGIIVTVFFTILPASANSAIRKWTPSGAQGVYLVGDNPIDVKSENLTFDLGSTNYVTAEYTLYNSSSENIEAELLFPIGMFKQSNGSIYNNYDPSVSLNGTNLDIQMRLLPSESNYLLDSLNNLKDDYVESKYDKYKFYQVKFENNDGPYYIKLTNAVDMNESNSFYTSDNFYCYTQEKNMYVLAVDSNGNEVPYTLVEAEKYDAVKYFYIKEYGKSIYDLYSEIDLYNIFVKDINYEEIYSVIDYKISIPASTSVVNTVKTNLYSGYDSRYSPSLDAIEYYLEPAESFKSFENLTITINTNDKYLITNNLDIETVSELNQKYVVKYDKLPNFNIQLGLSDEPNPRYTNKALGTVIFQIIIMAIILIATVGVLLFAAILVPLIITIKKKIFKYVFMLIIENIVLAFAIGFASRDTFSTNNLYVLVLAVLFTIAASIRLAGALSINKKVYTNKTWIFDSICFGFEICSMMICLVTYFVGYVEFYKFLSPISIALFAFNIAYMFFRKTFYIHKEVPAENKVVIENNVEETEAEVIANDNQEEAEEIEEKAETEEIKEDNKEE